MSFYRYDRTLYPIAMRAFQSLGSAHSPLFIILLKLFGDLSDVFVSLGQDIIPPGAGEIRLLQNKAQH